MTKTEIDWAKSHDWYVQDNGEVVMVRDEFDQDNTQIFSDFELLREWAGF